MPPALVCLGCGLEVGVTNGCACAPPTPPRAPTASPYRAAAERAPCPRCQGGLVEETYHDVSVLDCSTCRGFFLSRTAIEELVSPAGQALRLAFPKRERQTIGPEVGYLVCPVCATRMNRTVFARVSGVVVDVCREHGVSFDTGEVNAIIAFADAGGMDRARSEAKAEHDAENARLRAAFTKEHEQLTTPMSYRGGGVRVSESFSRALRDLFG